MKIQFHRRIVAGILLPAVSLPLLYAFSSSSFDRPSSEELAGLDDLSSGQAAGPSGETAEVVLQSSGAIENDIATFRALLGDPNNGGTAGQQPSGRREINWDGVPAAVTDVPNFPPDFFNVNSKRGLVYNHASPGLEVSDASFTDINPSYGAEFTPFSGTKLFSPVGSNASDVQFLVAGSDTRALVRGFGVVFSDVDVAGSTGIILIGEDGRSLGRILAPVRTDARGSSFVGVVFRNPTISRVRIISGNGVLGPLEKDVSQGGQHDLVVMDDFIYGEPSLPQ